jgi:uncharacterized Rossmann fold enzyme
MKFSEWEPVYLSICEDFGYSPDSDAMSVRMLKAVTPNSDLRDEDSIIPLIGRTVPVVGDSPDWRTMSPGSRRREASSLPVPPYCVCSAWASGRRSS